VKTVSTHPVLTEQTIEIEKLRAKVKALEARVAVTEDLER